MKYLGPILLLGFSVLSGCFDDQGYTPKSIPTDQEIWDLVSSGCGATIYSAPSGGSALRLTLGSSSATARVSSLSNVVCTTQESIFYPTPDSMRIVDGEISCSSSSASDQYPWNDGPDDITFEFVKTSSNLILSKPKGDAGCNSLQSFNYVFKRI